MKSKRIQRIGFLLCAVGIVLMLALWLFFYLSLKPAFLNRCLQNSVLGMDKEMQLQIENGLDHDALEKSQTGLTVFRNDTLVFWNRNDVDPKLLKRNVVVGHDTICPLFSGNYYVKSYVGENLTYYVFKLVNTTYRIDNPYFANESPCLPKFIDANISVFDNTVGEPLVNASGKILAKYQFTDKPKLKKPFIYLWPLPLIVIVIVGLILAFAERREVPKLRKGSHIAEIGIFIILLVSKCWCF